MHLNNLSNIGTNVSLWVSLVMLFFATLILTWLLNKSIVIVHKTVDPQSSNDAYQVKLGHALIVFVFAAVLLLLFSGFGAGRPVELTPVDETGHIEMIEATPDGLTMEELEVDAERHVPSALRQFRDRLEAQEDPDEVIRRAIEDSGNGDIPTANTGSLRRDRKGEKK